MVVVGKVAIGKVANAVLTACAIGGGGGLLWAGEEALEQELLRSIAAAASAVAC